jgi:hypothetical protein
MSKRQLPPAHWKPGQSGNPAGRPPGSGEIGKLRAAIRERLPDIIDRLTEQAAGGDVGAARLLLERVISPIKAAEETAPMNLPDAPLTDQGRAVLAAVGAGELAPAHAAQLLSGLVALAKLIETDELERRITELEARAS